MTPLGPTSAAQCDGLGKLGVVVAIIKVFIKLITDTKHSNNNLLGHKRAGARPLGDVADTVRTSSNFVSGPRSSTYSTVV